MVIHLTVMTSGMPCAKSRFIPYGMADKSFCIVELSGTSGASYALKRVPAVIPGRPKG